MSDRLPYILCVDDDEMNRELVEVFLEDSYEVVSVANGQECLDSVAERKPDLILLDVMMPVMGGKETCIQLMQNPLNRDIPIVVLSARSYQGDITTMLEHGAAGYLTKPFSEESLREGIKKYLKT